MKKKLLSTLLVGIIVVGLTGCGKSFESKILNKEFSYDITGYNDTLIATETFIFKENGNGIVKDLHPNPSKDSETEFTYDLNEDKNEISVYYKNGKTTQFSYSESNDCIRIINDMESNNLYCNK